MTNKTTLKRVMTYVGKYWHLMLLSLLLGIISVAMTIYIPYQIGKAIDLIKGFNDVDFDGITSIAMQLYICIFILFVSQWTMTILNNKITYKIIYDMRVISFRNLTQYPLSFLDNHRPGEIVNIVINDVDTFADGLLMGFSQLFTGLITIIGTLVFMFVINWILALVVLALTPLSLFIAKYISSHTYAMFKKQSEIKAEQTGFVEEMISSLKVVQAYNHTDENLTSFEKINEELEKCSLKATFYSSLVNPTTRFVYALIYALVAVIGAVLCVNSTSFGGIMFSVGMLATFLAYANQYTKPFNEITGVITELQNAVACVSRVFALMDEEKEKVNKDAVELSNVQGNIDIDHVYFSYTEKPLIQDFNLHVNSGKKIAIVGPTGCGKTTLINLLMRFYDPNSGEIKVDNISIKEITRESLRTNYGMVLQDIWLKSGTIKENIKMGKTDASDEEIINAAKATHSDSFIRRLPQGYDTIINEDGEGLSQGQKQLLCITRIMLALPPMLILDEATSSIDTRTEIKIQEAFDKLMQGKTSFIVAHRLSTIRNADIILVMNEGNVIESGSHNELIQKDGFYAKLYNSQFEN